MAKHRTRNRESQSSKAYSQGRAVKYSYRVKGPSFPVKIIQPAQRPARKTARHRTRAP